MNSLISKAKDFAFSVHGAIDHRRKYTGEPYTVHLENVAMLVASVIDDEAMIAAAYLHDTVEDTDTTISDILDTFGDDVAYLVGFLSDVSTLEDGNRKTRKRIDRKHIAKGDARVHTIKLADLIDNSESIQAHDPKFAETYLAEKRLLLEVLSDGHPALLSRAQAIIHQWQNAAVPYLSYLQALSTDAAPPAMDWTIANKNYRTGSDRVDHSPIAEKICAALEAFDERPGSDTGELLYECLLTQNWPIGEGGEATVGKLGESLSLDPRTVSKLLDFAKETPHRAVFINCLLLLLELAPGLDQRLLRTAAFDVDLRRPVWRVHDAEHLKTFHCDDPLTLALSGSWGDGDKNLFRDQLSSDSADWFKGLTLRYAIWNSSPEFSRELFGELNPDFLPAVVNFVKQNELLNALDVKEIDDSLCCAALRILSEGVCECFGNNVDLEFFKESISIEKILVLLIGHLEGRTLSIYELVDLAYIYYWVFEEVDRWLREDAKALFCKGDLVVSRSEHQRLAKSIRDILTSPANASTLNNALAEGGWYGPNGQMSLDRILEWL